MNDPDFSMEDDDTTFIKNLENVQGDERDIIIVSICYGYDDDHNMLMNFGPINQVGGDKRLNVVFSRSKKHMVVVSSIKHEDIVSENEGALSLKNFLQFAENPSVDKDSSYTMMNRMTEEVKSILDEMSLEYNTQVGKPFDIDLVVKQGNEFTLGIFIDFFNYDKEADVLNNFVIEKNILKKFGWTTCIINPLDLIYRRQNIKNLIMRKII